MAGLDVGLTVPVWLAEDDLGCIICHGLLAWPVTLPCGHTFCRDCLKDMWGAERHRSCPTCRECPAQQLALRKNTLLQDLADKYSRAVAELQGDPDPPRSPAPSPSPRPPRRSAPQRVGRRDPWFPSLLGPCCTPFPSWVFLPRPFYFHITVLL